MNWLSGLRFGLAVGATIVGVTFTAVVAAGEKFPLGEGAFQLPVPDGWNRKPPRTRIVEHEFEVPAVEGDPQPGRVTVMGAGGSVEDNVARWYGQFSSPNGGDIRETAKTKKMAVAGRDVTLVDITGTFEDKAGPFVPGPGVKRENYRMLGAIIETKTAGNYFIKFTGPQPTVGKNEEAFVQMINGLEAK